jgi:hypothetical protein
MRRLECSHVHSFIHSSPSSSSSSSPYSMAMIYKRKFSEGSFHESFSHLFALLFFFQLSCSILLLHSGSFSVVRAGLSRKTGESVAIKIVDKRKYENDPSVMLQIEREAAILKRIQHPNIIGVKDIFSTSTSLYMVLEL